MFAKWCHGQDVGLEALVYFRNFGYYFSLWDTLACCGHQRIPGTAEAQLTIATSPDQYDARQDTTVVSKAKDQGDCSTSVAFATVAGAEAAVASVAGVQGSSISLSELDLFYCSKADDDGVGDIDEDVAYKSLPDVTCQSGNSIGDSVKELQRRNLQTRYCMPYAAQRVGLHAVFVVGYNNIQKYWIVKNSFGSKWADKGFFKVAMGVCNVMDPNSTYGISWSSSIIKRRPAKLIPAPGRPGCFFYQAQVGDYASKVSLLFGVELGSFLTDNTGRITDLTSPLAGQQLMVCQPHPGTYNAPGAPAADSILDRQLSTLMNIKRIIDKEEVLQEWNWQSGIHGGYCIWPGISCDTAQAVVVALDVSYDTIHRSLRGQLPAGSLLKGLPGLRLDWFTAEVLVSAESACGAGFSKK
eukprot:gene9052-9222_t